MGFKILALFWMFLIRWSEVAYTSWDMELLPRNAVWRTYKESPGLLIYKKMCGSFPWDMCIIFTEEFHFSLPPSLCITCTHVCSSSAVISKISAPPLPSHLHPTAPKERDYVGRREIFLNASFSCVKGDGEFEKWSECQPRWLNAITKQIGNCFHEREGWVDGGGGQRVFMSALSFFFSLSLSLSSSFLKSQGIILG